MCVCVCDLDLCGSQRDERDTVFAQAYLNKVKLALQVNHRKTYEAFVKLLYNFRRSENTPVEVSTGQGRLD